MTTVLLVEDDHRLRRALRATFRTGHYEVLEAENGEAGLALLADHQPDLVVLDLKLPGMSGFEVLGHLRAFSQIPVVVLTVHDALEDKVAALDAGADDYVVKPFHSEELLARARANLRRFVRDAEQRGPVVRAGDLHVDLARRQVTKAGAPVALTPLEFRLLEVLVANRGRLLTWDQLLDSVWGDDRSHQRTRLRVTIVGLRRKIGDDASNPRMIFTEPGLGYRWIADDEELSD